jgi:hypothetical protein
VNGYIFKKLKFSKFFTHSGKNGIFALFSMDCQVVKEILGVKGKALL